MPGAAIVFFAFIGFDIVATAAEETRNPQRDMPRGILGSLAICTAALRGGVAGGRRHAALHRAQRRRAAGRGVLAPSASRCSPTIIGLGALIGLTSVVMILLLGQSRVLFAMSRDRLLRRWFATVHPRYGTPYRITIAIGVLVAVMAGFVPLGELTELVNIGTLPRSCSSRSA